MKKQVLTGLTLTGLVCLSTKAATTPDDWKSQTISPVANPLFFEDPNITTEVRPVFMQQYMPDTFSFAGGSVPLGGSLRVYAVQLRVALTDRLGFIASKDGYIEFQPNHTLGHTYGWANIAFGAKYAVVDDPDKQFIVTPGLTLEVPSGNERVFQGRGSGEWNPFVSAEKGFDAFHVTGNLGFRVPNDMDDQTAQMHYSLQFDYRVCQYFTPFIAANGYTILTEANNKLLGAVNLNTEMYDLINFGSTEARGRTQLTLAGGFRSRVWKKLDLGFAYEGGIVDPKGIFDSRVTADAIWHF